MLPWQKYPIGSFKAPKFLRRITSQITFFHFEPTAREHDSGAMEGTKLLRKENDDKMLEGFKAAAMGQKRWVLRWYLMGMAYVFYGLVKLNPWHYKGDEKKILLERKLNAHKDRA